MNYLFSSESSKSRAQSLKEIKSKFPMIKEVKNSADEIILELLFQSSRQFFALRIHLDQQYPASKPVLQVVQPTFSHPWLDHHRRIVGCGKLNHWTKHSVLSEVVQECLTQFQQAPLPTQSTQPPPYNLANPNAVPSAATSTTAYMIPSNSNNVTQNTSLPFTTTARGIIVAGGTGPPQSSVAQQPSSRTGIPLIRSTFPELDRLSIDELKALQGDFAALQALIVGTTEAGDLVKQRDEIKAVNERVADENIHAHESYEVLCSEVAGLQQLYEKELIAHQSKLNELSRKYQTTDLRTQLEDRKRALNNESQESVRQLSEGTMELEVFIKTHKEQRTRFYCIQEKLKHST